MTGLHAQAKKKPGTAAWGGFGLSDEEASLVWCFLSFLWVRGVSFKPSKETSQDGVAPPHPQRVRGEKRRPSPFDRRDIYGSRRLPPASRTMPQPFPPPVSVDSPPSKTS